MCSKMSITQTSLLNRAACQRGCAWKLAGRRWVGHAWKFKKVFRTVKGKKAQTWLFCPSAQFSRDISWCGGTILSRFLLWCTLKHWHCIWRRIQKPSPSSFSLENYQQCLPRDKTRLFRWCCAKMLVWVHAGLVTGRKGKVASGSTQQGIQTCEASMNCSNCSCIQDWEASSCKILRILRLHRRQWPTQGLAVSQFKITPRRIGP